MDLAAFAGLGSTGALEDVVVRVDLDDVDRCPSDVIDRAVDVAGSYPGVTVGCAESLRTPVAHRVSQALTTTIVAAGRGPTVVVAPHPDRAIRELGELVAGLRDPAWILAQVLRAGASMKAQDAIRLESLAYAALQGGQAFRAWRDRVPVRDRSPSHDAVRLEREDGLLRLTLDRPERRNALDAAARQALSDALDLAIADPSTRLELSGRGPCFSSGGDLDEFGTASDFALAHQLRVVRGPAPRLAKVAGRATAKVHGSCVGAGVELAAFAARVVAAPGTTFRLPEVSMGLIPGSGGTVSVVSRVGRWRAAWLMLTGAELDLETALAWGLVDELG